MSRMTKEEARKLVLGFRKYDVRIVPESADVRFTSIDPKHDGAHIFTGCKNIIRLPLSRTQQGLVKILQPNEQEAFEVLLDREAGYLSFYRKEDNFWTDFSVELKKEGITLDESDVLQNLQIRLLKASPQVANSYEERLENKVRWMLVDTEYQVKDDISKSKRKNKAIAELAKIEGNSKLMFDIVKSMGIPVPAGVDGDWAYDILSRVIEGKYGQLTIEDFEHTIKDDNLTDKARISDAIRKGEIQREAKNKFKLRGGDIIANSQEELLDWWKDPVNQKIVQVIKKKITEND